MPTGSSRWTSRRFEPRRLTQATRDTCTRNHVATRDVVGEFVDARTLSYDSGCGYEHEWNALPMLLRNPGTAKMTTQAVPRPPPSSFALGPDGQIWLADGTCAEPATFGRVMVSSDHGERWRPVAVKTLSAQPVRQVILDRSHAGTALIFTASCGSAAHTEPGWIYLTDNGGKTFRPIAVPPGIPGENGRPADEQDPIQAVVAPDGMLNHLVVYGQSTQIQPGQIARWESRDGGRTWQPLAPVAAAPKPTVPMATIGGDGAGDPQGRPLPNAAGRGSGSRLSLFGKKRQDETQVRTAGPACRPRIDAVRFSSW